MRQQPGITSTGRPTAAPRQLLSDAGSACSNSSSSSYVRAPHPPRGVQRPTSSRPGSGSSSSSNAGNSRALSGVRAATPRSAGSAPTPEPGISSCNRGHSAARDTAQTIEQHSIPRGDRTSASPAANAGTTSASLYPACSGVSSAPLLHAGYDEAAAQSEFQAAVQEWRQGECLKDSRPVAAAANLQASKVAAGQAAAGSSSSSGDGGGLLTGQYDEAAARLDFMAAVQEWRLCKVQAAPAAGRLVASSTSTATAATKACSTMVGHAMCTQTASQAVKTLPCAGTASPSSSYFCKVLLGSKRQPGSCDRGNEIPGEGQARRI